MSASEQEQSKSSQPNRVRPERLDQLDTTGLDPSSPYSTPSRPCPPAPPPAEQGQDEHDRAVRAFLRENGFTTLTSSRRRQSLVGTTYPLHCAASQGLVRMTELLIKAGADPSQKNLWGQSA